MMCHDLGLDEGTSDATQMAYALHRALLTEHERGRQVVLVIDEADAISLEVLANFLRLSHFRAFTGEPLLQMVLWVSQDSGGISVPHPCAPSSPLGRRA